MIEIRNRVRIAALLFSPLLLLNSCSSEPDDVQTDESALVFNGSLQINLLSVTKGQLPPGGAGNLGLAFPGFSPTTAGWFSMPSSANIGTCNSIDSKGLCTSGIILPKPWTKTVSVDTNKPPTTIIYTGQMWIPAIGGLGAPTFARCFHFGLDTTTYLLKPVPVSSAGCPAGSPNDQYDKVTCDATTCTANISIGATGEPYPWKVKFGYKVTVPTYTGSVTLVPDFMITNVYYAPPGKMTNVSYSSTTSVGTTTSMTKSFENELNVTTGASTDSKIYGKGGLEITAGHKWKTEQSDDIDISVDRTAAYTKYGQLDGIDHDWDEIWLLIRPQVVATYTRPVTSSKPTKMSWVFATNQDGLNNAIPYFVYAGWLNGHVTMPDNVQGALTSYGITPDYYPQILAADPLADGTLPSPMWKQSRYQYLGEHPYIPPLSDTGGLPSTQAFTVKQETTSTSTTTETETYTVGVTTNGSASVLDGLIDLDFKVDDTMTWENSSSQTLSNGKTQEDTLTVAQPEYGYQGPTFLHVYEDTIYKTYAFSLDRPCGGTGDGGNYCNLGGTKQVCTSTVWGFEPAEPFAWSNSAETSSGVVSGLVHSGTQSLQISASSDPAYPARINATPCTSSSMSGAMDLRGKTFTAWVYVPTSSSSYTGTSCRLRAFDAAFHESGISTKAVSSPIKPGSWFKLSASFPFTSVEAAIYELTVECKLPSDWTYGDPSKVWYVDDVSVNTL